MKEQYEGVAGRRFAAGWWLATGSWVAAGRWFAAGWTLRFAAGTTLLAAGRWRS